MKSNHALRILTLLVGLATHSGCQPPDSPPAARSSGDGDLTIAVIPKGTTHIFWQSVRYGAEEAGRELGAKILFRGPQKESDRRDQINVFQGFVNKRVDGICLSPLDAQALVRPVRQATESGVPVVIFDSGLEADPGDFVSYVATDNFRGGVMAADRMAATLGGQGDVIMLRYSQGSDSTHQREEGFLEGIAKHEGIRVLSSDQYAGTTTASAINRAQQLLNKYAESVDGIFAVCEPNAKGVLRALQDQKLAGKVSFIAFDSSDQLREGLEAGEVDSIVLQDPVQMGYLAVKTTVASLRGEAVEDFVDTGVFLATRANMGEEKIARLLRPEIAE